ncbi:MAG: tRNA adenosine(34) deaminase TadA [Oscillospiraceae bacterium]|nr:tRNA adenosine(34) deaminase TadA [Oscillospiraceae bacterium]MDD7294962.1 tRNA adenosine(34) deaminase TadA [Oscillospiraceae bacterium]MDY2510897.1 tRNA adenosine(34) deaminase TadA [Ruminococcus callidus]
MEKIPHTPQTIYMQRALELASHAAALGEVPVGAVIVHKPTNRIIGEGWNLRESGKSPLAHAEIMAIDQASRTLGGWRIVDSAIYVTLEPCPMCCGAILHARLDDLIFGAYDPKGGAVISVESMFSLPYNYRPQITDGFLQEQCAALLTNFFRELRQQKQQAKKEHKTSG